MSEIRNLPRDLASGVSEVVRKRLGKTENVLTAEGAAGVQSLVEIDRDYEEATQYIHAADAEILDKGGPVDLAITRCWQAFLLVQKHEPSILSQQVVLLLIHTTINVANDYADRYNKIMGDAEAAIDLLASMLPDETKRPAFKEKIMAEFAAAGGLTAHNTAAQTEPLRPTKGGAPSQVFLEAGDAVTTPAPAAPRVVPSTPQEISELEQVLTLARLRVLYQKKLEAIELPKKGGFTSQKQADFANQLGTTYRRLRKLEKELGIVLGTEKDDCVTEAEKLEIAYRRAHPKPKVTTPSHRSPPRAPQAVPPPAP